MLMPVGWDGPALAVMGWGTEAVIAVGRTVAAWPGAALTAPPIPAWGAGIFALGLCWLCLWRLRWRWLGVPVMAAALLSGLAADPPQLLVSSDARLIAVTTPAGVLVERTSGGSRWTRDSWLRAWGEEGSSPLPPEGGPPEATCTREACRLQPTPDGPIALLLRPRARASRREPAPPIRAEPHCGAGAILLSAEPIRGRCPGTPVVDRFSVWRDGAHAVWLGRDGVRILSDRATRGDRPWVPPVPIPRPRPGGEPAADRDPGGAPD
ncbi:hypothetical protein ACE7GA_20465 [Roseomonas sp. CCTCC AB2023176]|uniref:hypothetical protein n=1 Tax=Roseomonas sp. CCTCC AB2023176 TaxID=3342640 RepID=UPI0035E287F8